MPFKVSDEAMDALDASPDDQRLKFFEGLSPDERSEVQNYHAGWKQRRSDSAQRAPWESAAQGAFTPALGPVGNEPTGAIAQPEAQPQPVGAASDFFDKQPGAQLLNAARKGVNAVLGKPLNYLGDKVAEGTDAYVDAEYKHLNKIGLPFTPANELAQRSLVQSLIGEEKAFKGMPEERRLAGINEADASGIPGGATTVQAVPYMAGSVAQFAIPGGKAVEALKGAEAAKAATVLGRAAQGIKSGVKAGFAAAPTNAAQNMVQGGMSGEDPVVAALTGFAAAPIFGGAVGGLGSVVSDVAKPIVDGVKKLLPKPYKVELQPQDAMKFFDKLQANNERMYAQDVMSIEAGALKPTASLDEIKAPSYYTIKYDPETGKLNAIVSEHVVGKKPVSASIPVDSEKQALEFARYAARNDIFGGMPDEITRAHVLNKLPETHQQRLLDPKNPPKYIININADDELYSHAVDPEFTKFEKVGNEFDDTGKLITSADRKTKEIRTSEYTPSGQEPTPKDPLSGQPKAPIQLTIEVDGHVKVAQPVGRDPLPGEAIAVGKVTHNGVEKTVHWHGTDPKNPGNILVSVKKGGPQFSIPEENYTPQLNERSFYPGQRTTANPWKEGLTSELPKPKILTPEEIGYTKSPDGLQSEAVYNLGKDPEVPGNILVAKSASETPRSIPVAEYHPQLSPKESLALRPDARAYPDKLLPGDVSAATAQSVSLGDDLNRMVVRNKSNGTVKFLQEQLLGGHQYGPEIMRDTIRQMQSAADVGAMKGAVRERLTQAIGGKQKLLDAVDRDLSKVGEGKMSWGTFEEMNPKVAEDVKAAFQPMLDRVKKNEDYLVSQGFLTKGHLDEEGAMRYFATIYNKHMLPKGKWAKFVPDQAIDTLAVKLEDSAGKNGKAWTKAQITNKIKHILGAEDTVEALSSSGLVKGKALDRLKEKQEMPPEWRAVLGESKSGVLRMAETLGSQEMLVARARVLDSIKQDPRMYSHGPQPHLDPRPVPADPKQFGSLAGGYVSPELYDTVINIPKIQAAGAGIWSTLLSVRKGGLISSARSWITSLVGNLQGSMYAGGLTGYDPVHDGHWLREAFGAIKGYRADPAGELGSAVRRARAAGADWVGSAEVEIGKHDPLMGALTQKLAKEKGVDAYTIYEQMGRVFNGYRGALGAVGSTMDKVDRIFRLANFMALEKKFSMNPAKYLPGIGPEAVAEEATKKAARMINDTFMNAAHVGKFVSGARKNAVGQLNLFLTSAIEEGRIIATLPRVMREDPALAGRLAGWGMLLGGLKYAATTGELGVPQEAWESSLAQRTDRKKTYANGLMEIPVGMDKHNNVMSIDLTKYILPAKLLQGHPDDSPQNRLLANVLTYGMSGGAGEEQLRNWMVQSGLIRESAANPKIMEGEAGINKLLSVLANEGFVPAMIPQAQQALKSSTYRNKMDPTSGKLNPMEAAGKAVLGGVFQVNNPASTAGIVESKYNIQDLQKQMKQVQTQVAMGNLSPQEGAERMKAIMSAIQNREVPKLQERAKSMQNYSNTVK